jgi:hypothetical protein
MDINELVLPLESSEFVMQNAKSVLVNADAVESLAQKIFDSLKDKNCSYFNWKSSPLNPKKMNEFAINWIFLVDTLNFSFWSDQELIQLPDPLPLNFKRPVIEKYKVIYNDVAYEGYWALCAAVNRALDVHFCYDQFHLFNSLYF